MSETHQTIQSIIQKSSFNNHIKNIPTNIKKLMLTSDSGDLIYNILPKANNSRGFKISEINQQVNANKKQKTKPPLYPTSSKHLTTTKDWFKKQTIKKNPHFLQIDTIQTKRVSVSERQARSRQSSSGLNTPQKGDSIDKLKINFKSQKGSKQAEIAIQTSKQLPKQKNQAKKTHRSIQKLEKDKVKRISRFLFQMQIPDQLKQKANYKLRRFKVVEDPTQNLLSQNNSKVSNMGSTVKQIQKKEQLETLNSQKIEKSRKNGIPDFIKPSLKMVQRFAQAFQLPSNKQQQIKGSLIKRDLKFENIQCGGIHTKNSEYQKRNTKYFLKMKKMQSNNIPQKQIRQINTCASQNTLVPRIDAHQLCFKTKQQRLNQRISSQDKLRQTAIKFKKDSLKRARERINGQRNQEMNICGWQMNDNQY